MSADLGKLATLIRETADEKILPRFRLLSSDDIEEKNKGDFVTIADKEAELFLTPRLQNLVSGSLVVGEEATAANPGLLGEVSGSGPIWYVDPIDGTSLFVKGEDGFAVMVAFADKGEVRQSAIFFPVLGEMFLAEKGAGVELTDETGLVKRLPTREQEVRLSNARGAFYTKHYPTAWHENLSRLKGEVASAHNEMCAAREYTDIARGAKDLATYHRMLPWDHAPGSLILSEVGGVARDMKSEKDYRPATLHGPHLLAANDTLWRAARDVVF